MSMKAPAIAILTDFGTSDSFAGVLKGVILQNAPGIPVVDLTHDIPPGDIRRAAVLLWQTAPYFPAGTVFLAIIDPGVGTSRKPLILQKENDETGFTFIGPDNGLFTLVASPEYHAWELQNRSLALPDPTNTFHGRDIFAPAAAHAAMGIRGPEFGLPVLNPVRLDYPRLGLKSSGSLCGEILFPDHFGNYLTSIGLFKRTGEGDLLFKPWLPGAGEMRLPGDDLQLILPDGARLSLVNTFNDIPPGRCAVLIGSSGLLEIASNRQSAAQILHLKPGDPVELSSVTIEKS
ncbi:MAG: S-adenosyl-l-methionine hydroxide adenosyltransferase family protein [Omnitrophica WOR_2 bacterium]